MSNFGALFTRLIELGVPSEEAAEILHDAVTIGVNTVQYRNPDIEKLEERRARDRARKAEERRVSAEFRGHPQTSEDGSASPPTPPNITTNPQSPSETTPKKSRGQTALPRDFVADEHAYSHGAERYSLSRSEVDDCVEALKNWAWGKGIRRSDWNRTLYQIFRSEAEKKRKAAASKTIPFNRGDRNGPTIQQTAHALADWAERRAASGE